MSYSLFAHRIIIQIFLHFITYSEAFLMAQIIYPLNIETEKRQAVRVSVAIKSV